MAAIAGTLIAAVIPIVTPLIQSLVRHVEGIFGPKTGQTKFEVVLKMLGPLLEQLSAAGKIPGIVEQPAVGAIIETIVQTLKESGSLPGGSPTQIPAVQPAGPSISRPGNFTITGTISLL